MSQNLSPQQPVFVSSVLAALRRADDALIDTNATTTTPANFVSNGLTPFVRRRVTTVGNQSQPTMVLLFLRRVVFVPKNTEDHRQTTKQASNQERSRKARAATGQPEPLGNRLEQTRQYQPTDSTAVPPWLVVGPEARQGKASPAALEHFFVVLACRRPVPCRIGKAPERKNQ